jgi:hypothetical protein
VQRFTPLFLYWTKAFHRLVLFSVYLVGNTCV